MESAQEGDLCRAAAKSRRLLCLRRSLGSTGDPRSFRQRDSRSYGLRVAVVTIAGVGAMDHVNGALTDGILSNPDDPAELKTKILRMLDPVHRSLLVREARETAEKYTWDNYLDRLEQTLLECTKRSSVR
jgi:glycosyltransferase involved in cell wall biosynthesis